MLKITDCRCEFTTEPLGVDTIFPRLSWKLRSQKRGEAQKAYQIVAASSLYNLSNGYNDYWDSGKVESPSQLVTYAGHKLHSGSCVWWQVMVWDKDNHICEPGEPTFFEVGLLDEQDWYAKWIGFPAGKNGKALFFRKVFKVDKPISKARIYASGLGQYELHLNGQKIGNQVLAPAWSTYSKRIYYNVYAVEDIIKTGENVAGVIVGNGWYGNPILLIQIQVTYRDGSTETVCASDAGWQVTSGPILSNSIYDGETYDARLELNDWDAVHYKPAEGVSSSGSMIVDSPGGKLVPEIAPPVRITQRINPVSISRPEPDVYVFDMAQNFAGWVQLKVSGNRGDRVTLKFAETLYANGTVNQENLRSAHATDVYILKGGEIEVWEPRFTYHGFRYVQVEGFPGTPTIDSIEGCVIHSDNEATGSFHSSSNLLNAIYKMVWWTEISNEPSIPTDCPQRDERMGWLNDMAARSEQIFYNFDVARFLSKWMTDIADTQDPHTGAITDTAPFRWGHRPADPVSVCYLLIPWLLYVHYGDTRTMATHYEGMKAWVGFLKDQSVDDILNYSYWGDWSPPVEFGVQGSIGSSAVSRNTPGALMSTGMLYYSTHLLSKMAAILGCDKDAHENRTVARRIAAAYHQKFYNPESGGYGSNNQACNAFSLYLDVVPDSCKGRVLENLVDDVVKKHNGHLTTGNLCTKYLLESLTAAGKADVAYTVATQETYPGWGYMLANGATTLWERWEKATGSGMNSHNHPMMGSIGSWLYRALAGIIANPDKPGFSKVYLKPNFISELQSVDARLETVKGLIISSWYRENNKIRLEVSIPVGCEAELSIPMDNNGINRIEENHKVIWGKEINDICEGLSIRENTSLVMIDLENGDYHIDLTFVNT